jgi:hypothetical protein
LECKSDASKHRQHDAEGHLPGNHVQRPVVCPQLLLLLLLLLSINAAPLRHCCLL